MDSSCLEIHQSPLSLDVSWGNHRPRFVSFSSLGVTVPHCNVQCLKNHYLNYCLGCFSPFCVWGHLFVFCFFVRGFGFVLVLVVWGARKSDPSSSILVKTVTCFNVTTSLTLHSAFNTEQPNSHSREHCAHSFLLNGHYFLYCIRASSSLTTHSHI